MANSKRYINFVVIAGIIVALFFLPIFAINKVTIRPDLFFVDTKQCQILCDSVVGENILKVLFLGKLKKALLPLHEIEKINVKVKKINQLEVSIFERKPWISTVYNGQSVFVDYQGVLLSSNNKMFPEDVENIFIVKGLNPDNFKKNVMDFNLLKSFKEYEVLFESYFPNQTLMLEQENNLHWTLMIDDTIKVKLGELDQLRDKFDRICYLIENDKKNNHNIISIDSRVEQKLFVVYEK